MNRIENLKYKKSTSKKNKKKAENFKKNTSMDNSNNSDNINIASTSQKQSRSEEKLERFQEYWQVEDVNEKSDSSYIFIHKDILPNIVRNQLCSFCNANTLAITVADTMGFASKIVVACGTCHEVSQEFFSSPHVDGAKKKPFDINKRLVEAIVMMGLGYAGLQKLCLSLDISIMTKATFQKLVQEISTDSLKLKKEMLAAAREQVRQHYLSLDDTLQTDDIINFTVTYDGTWQKRGYSSLYGIGIVIELYTGLVIDYHVLSKFCRLCTEKRRTLENSEEFNLWQRQHKNKKECHQNFYASSGAMEAYAAEILWKRSIEMCNARYVNILSDGDAKTFSHLTDLQVYGPEYSLVREQCVNHVSKCFVTALKNLVKDSSVRKITLGGRKPGSLTTKVMTDLGGYYRNAIVKNSPHIRLMKDAILATLEHYDSTDETPKHELCPSGSNSWCWFKRSIAKGQEPPSHNTKRQKINKLVIQHIRPIYERLSNVELLERCVRGGTQNANESLHHMIWSKCKKETFQSKEKLETAVIFAISEFNMGCENTQRLKRSIQGQELSLKCKAISTARDQDRVRKSVLLQQDNTRRSIKRRKHEAKQQEKKKRRLEGPSYQPGTFI